MSTVVSNFRRFSSTESLIMRRFSNTFAFWGDCRLLFPFLGDFPLLILWFWGDFRKLIPFVSSSQFVIPNLFCPNRTRLLTLSSTIKTILWYNIYEYSIRKFHFFVYWCICIFYFIYLSVVHIGIWCTFDYIILVWLEKPLYRVPSVWRCLHHCGD